MVRPLSPCAAIWLVARFSCPNRRDSSIQSKICFATIKLFNPVDLPVVANAHGRSKTTWSSLHGSGGCFHRNGDGLGELKRHLTFGREESYVLTGLVGTLGIFLGGLVLSRAFRSSDRIGFQRVGLSVDDHRSKGHLQLDRKSTRLNSSHGSISYAVF